MAEKFIWITTSFEGFHQFREAPASVAYLAHLHRHIFHVKVWIEVWHDNRDIEFILFKDLINNIIKDSLHKEDLGSCEMIADQIYAQVTQEYPDRKIIIEVSEDNENGCRCTYP